MVLFFKNYILWTFKDMSLFSYQGSLFVAVSAATSLLYQALFCLSRTFLTFFQKFFWSSFVTHSASIDFIIDFRCCQQLFSTFWIFYFFLFIQKKYGEGGIWTLAPRERSTPLAGAPLQPLEYFSKFNAFSFEQRSSVTHLKLYFMNLFLSMLFLIFFNYLFCITGMLISVTNFEVSLVST